VNRRFVANRGLALALTLSGTGLASTFVPYVGSQLVLAYGWRGAFIGLALIGLAVTYPLVVWLFARSPETVHIVRTEREKRQLLSSDFFSRKFLALAAAMLLYTLATTGLGINAVPVLMDKGFTLADAAEVVGLIGIGTIVGRLLGGVLLDRIDGRFVAMGSGVAALGAVAILLAGGLTPLTAAAACLLLGLSSGAEFDACAYLASRHFPPQSFASLFGVISGMAGVGSGIAPVIANELYEMTGSYDTGLYAIIPMFVASCVAFLLLGPYPDAKEA
jgi:fucose permease